MFKLFNTADERIGMTDRLNYIRKHDNGSYVLCDEPSAEGVAFNGHVYSLFVDRPLDDAPFVRVETVEASAEIEAITTTNGITFVTMAETGSFDASTMAEHSDLFAPWASGVAYKTGNIRSYKEKLYKCVQDHTSQDDWIPDVSVSLWTLIADPSEEWPAWSQPIGAHDSYMAGDKVSHADKHWTSEINNNVWEPGVYGWIEYVKSEE